MAATNGHTNGGPAKHSSLSNDIVRTQSGLSSLSMHSFNKDIGDLCTELESHIENGLDPAFAAERRKAEGPNALHKEEAPSLAILFLLQLTNLIIALLIGAGAGSIIVNATSMHRDDPIAYVEGIAIFLIVLINAGIAAYTEQSANNALEALSKMTAQKCNVIRGGKNESIPSVDVCRGDIVVLETGDICPADIRLIKADEMKVNEMVLTGEAADVNKTADVPQRLTSGQDPEVSPTSLPASSLTPPTMAFTSCEVTNGKGVGVVTKIGMETRVGKIAAMLSSGEKKTTCGCLPDTSANMTPMQVAFQALGVRIGYGAVVTCMIVFFVGWGLGAVDPNMPEQTSWMYMILVSVTLAVAAIPEGIPLCVTISLSMGCASMVNENVLVRRLAAVETLGSASVICSDKTGTLTEGKMTMVKAWSGGIMYNVLGKGFDPTIGGFVSEDEVNCNMVANVRSTIYAGWLCSNCKIIRAEDEATKQMLWKPFGNSSEAPITVAAGKLKLWSDGGNDDSKANPRVLEIPFSSQRKMMMTVHEIAGTGTLGKGGVSITADDENLVIVKGAPDMVIKYCTHQLLADGSVGELTEEDAAGVFDVIGDLSDQALRVLAIAYKTLPELPYTNDEGLTADQKFKRCRCDLTLAGLVASHDPEREGVPEAIADSYSAHIRVIMITGDYVKTAIAIAKAIGVLTSEDAAVIARDPELTDPRAPACDSKALRPNGEYLDEADLDVLISAKKVFARAQPEDKLEIVASLQRQGLVVSMTGDGVNDAPALNKADIGVAMGIQGTEVAKGASDMILTDDNFCSIVKAVEKGRVIYAGIQKFVAFIMSVHIGEVFQIFICIVFNIPVMRTPLQILFLILVTDLPPSIALGMEKGQAGILKERPRPKKESLVLPWMWVGIFVNGLILTGVAVTIYLICLARFVGPTMTENGDPRSALNLYDIADTIGEQCAGQNMKTCSEPTTLALTEARTAAFVCVVWCENWRAYVSRSFHRPVWEGMFDNWAMQKAIFMAQVALYCVICVPVLSDKIMRLDGVNMRLAGWLLGIGGGFACLIICEIYKLFVKRQIDAYQAKVLKETAQVFSWDQSSGAGAKLEANVVKGAAGSAPISNREVFAL
jgi:potassium/sodium efflux P-type ATPase